MASSAGQGGVYLPKYTATDGTRRESSKYWIRYSVSGRKYREPSGSRTKRDAVELLNRRLHEHGQGIVTGNVAKVQLPQLAELIRNDYRRKNRKSADRLEISLHHLLDAFSDWRVIDVQEPAIDRYVADRLDDGAANATINRELAALRRMFNLGKRARLVGRIPTVDMLTENNARSGFFEADAHAAVLAALPTYARPIAEVAYLTGWRKGELLSRQWRHIDLETGWLRLDPGETKNGRGRDFPVIEQLHAVLAAQSDRKVNVERSTGRIVTALFFHDDGRPVKNFRGVWLKAVKEAGCPERVFHDYRRTAARNLVRAGIPASQAKEFTGHETLSVFDRYAISDAVSLQEAGAKYAASLHLRPANPPLPLEAAGKVRAK